MSSATVPSCGRSSLSSKPHLPWRENFQNEPRTLGEAWATLSYLRLSPGNFWPCHFVSIGLWSKRSICDGPPIMKSEIIALALAGRGGCLGRRSKTSLPRSGLIGAASRPSWRSNVERPSMPRPKPPASRKWRREQSPLGSLVDMEETVGGEEDLAKGAERFDAGILRGRGRGREGGLRRGFLGGGVGLHRLDL